MNAFGVRYWLALCLCAWSIGAHPSPVFQSIQQLGGFLNSDGNNVTFRVYSAAATRIEVDLYKQASGVAPAARYTLTKQSGTSLWSVQVSASSLRSLGFDIDPTNASKLFTNVYYGYRAWGSNWTYSSAWNANGNPGAGFVADVDTTGARFNPNKLLLDPYALEMSHDYTSAASQDPTIFASGVSASGGTADRLRNSELVAPKGIVAMPFGAGWAALNFGSKPAGVQKDDVIYEVDLRGLSRNDSAAGSCAGTYQGAIAEIPYLQSLGITALELQPVHETENDANDMNIAALGRASNTTAGDNYWGYMTTDYFAPDRHYACDKSLGGPTREFVAMVKAYHDAGIKVVLDVVYNHSGEGGLWSGSDPTKANLWSLRGLDNATYYLLTRDVGKSDDMSNYYDITGTGNTLNTHNGTVQNLIVDSLTFYRNTLGVDGYRFDLGIALVNTYDNTTNPTDMQRFYFGATDTTTAMAKVTAAFPGVFLSAEPWGLAPNGQGYQQGNMPNHVSEWNGMYRDTIRKAANKYGIAADDSAATRSAIATRVAGSQDLFGNTNGRNAPWFSVNFVNVHDGFTLNDVFSCQNQNVTQGWPYGPSDGGTADENQWDNGGNAVQQRQQARTAFALLMLSAGVPIFNGGDEFLRSVNCNNNYYNVDSTATWLNRGVLTSGSPQYNFKQFAQAFIAFRKNEPALRPNAFYATTNTGNGDNMAPLDWFGSDGSYRTTYSGSDFWQATPASPDATGQNRTLVWRYDGSQLGGGDLILVLYNAEPTLRTFTLPWTGPSKTAWYRVTDTASWDEGPNQFDPTAATRIGGQGSTYGVNPRSLVLLIAK